MQLLIVISATPLEAQIYLTSILKSFLLCKSFVCYIECKAFKI